MAGVSGLGLPVEPHEYGGILRASIDGEHARLVLNEVEEPRPIYYPRWWESRSGLNWEKVAVYEPGGGFQPLSVPVEVLEVIGFWRPASRPGYKGLGKNAVFAEPFDFHNKQVEMIEEMVKGIAVDGRRPGEKVVAIWSSDYLLVAWARGFRWLAAGDWVVDEGWVRIARLDAVWSNGGRRLGEEEVYNMIRGGVQSLKFGYLVRSSGGRIAAAQLARGRLGFPVFIYANPHGINYVKIVDISRGRVHEERLEPGVYVIAVRG